MKTLVGIICYLLLLGCDSSYGEQGRKKMVKFYENGLFEKLQKAPKEQLRVLVYEVEKVDVRDHHQSIFLENSEVLFKIIKNNTKVPFSKGLERITVFYDKYGINKLEMGGDFKKGQEWELTFNKNKELVKIRFHKK